MTNVYTELELVADEQFREHLIGILSQIGFEGFWEEGSILRCYISKERWSDGMLEEVERVARTIHRSGNSVLPKISVREIEGKNWNEEWEETIQPIHVTERIVITPSWHDYAAKPGELVLIIDPKMSFGTGYHETTRLVLKLMERYVKPGIKLLDVGTGTGVLAIAGIKLGASSAVGVDNDEWSYDNAIENLQLNHVENTTEIILGELSTVPAGRFDMIVANIQRNVIEPLLPEMKLRLASGGTIILSGLLNIDEEPMRKAITDHGFLITRMISENEWIALMLTSVIPNP
ncbi:MAG: 50S ribosomal protein L11 methyltransferase [Bacteroidetes bacterium]|nr:50S ribosomal protein L11 methyltransferase [Bacteroidota bacterium]MCW5894298.1 50S ribosomal protein L11 methyltransferase [Bacteroidota bacterium]